MPGALAMPGPAEITIASADGAFALWYAEGGQCNPDPGPHWQMVADDKHVGVGSRFETIAHVVCATSYVHHFVVYGERGNHESRLCGFELRAGRLRITSGSSRCVLSRGAQFVTLH